jgi:hypothetical protein
MEFSLNNLMTRFKGLSRPAPKAAKDDGLFTLHHWELFCLSLFLGGLGMIALSGYFFYQTAYNTFSSEEITGSTETQTFSRDTLEETIERFEEKKRVFEELRVMKPQITTP